MGLRLSGQKIGQQRRKGERESARPKEEEKSSIENVLTEPPNRDGGWKVLST